MPVLNVTRYIYVWQDKQQRFRSKVKYSDAEDQPGWWQYDGSSTGQSGGPDTEIYLKPVRCYDMPPFETYNQMLVLCETYLKDKTTPHPDNVRHFAEQVLISPAVKEQDPWYGFEMEFFMYDQLKGLPLGFETEDPPEQGTFYCGVGAGNCFGRQIMNEFEALCLKCNINIVGSNAEVACGQWEYQIFGKGLRAPDDVCVSQFLLSMVAEKYNVSISWHPKPFLKCNGSGMHVNFSTEMTRSPVHGREGLAQAIEKLRARHHEHIAVYGKNNERRLTGKHESSSLTEFSHGVGTRHTSIRINHETNELGYGYLEDRRPAASCNMYMVAMKLADTIIN
jgi:glutamine synthetase